MSRTPWDHPARAVLASVRYAGMGWHVDAGRLFVTGHTGRLTAEHRAAIEAHRSELVRILESLPARCVVPHLCCALGPCDPATCRQAAPQEGRDAA